MSDVLSTGSAWLHQQRHACTTNTVTLARGNQSCSANATRSDSVHRYQDAYGVLVRVQMRDYVFRTQDYAPTGAASLPVVGDCITDNGVVFEVLSPGGGLPSWEYSDRARLNLRVFTKEIA